MKSKKTTGFKNKGKIVAALFAAPLACSLGVNAFGADAGAQPDSELLKSVLQRLDQQASEIKELKSEISAKPAASTSSATTIQWQHQLEKQDAEIKDLKTQLTEVTSADSKVKYPNVSFHGFGELDYSADSRRGQTIPYGQGFYGGRNTFYLGELDIFLNAQLAENISVLSENVVSVGSDNHSGLDIERLILQYRGNDYFNVDAGRFHTALGYYNTTYHHGAWLQNATGRPTFLQFEDSGGILPVHMVGISVHGKVPSGSLNLNYFAEVGNGMNFSTDGTQSPVQQLISQSDSKALNFAVVAKPEWLPGLQFGGGVYFDIITPDTSTTPTNYVPRNTQLIYNGHIVYHNAQWELIAEGYLISDHAAKGGGTHNSPAFFVQASRKFDSLTPYARFTYYNVSLNDPLYTVAWAGGINAGKHYGPSVGLRYDLSNFVALKAQYDYLVDTGLNSASRINLQASFTF